jgi:hypothetical protein
MQWKMAASSVVVHLRDPKNGIVEIAYGTFDPFRQKEWEQKLANYSLIFD